MYKIIKKLSYCIFVLLFTNVSFAQNLEPSFVFKELESGKRYIGVFEKNGDYQLGTYYRKMSRDDISYYDSSERYKIELIPHANYDIYSIKQNVLTSGISYYQKAVYIFNKNGGNNIGYCLMDSISIKGPYPEIEQIKSLSINNNFVDSSLSLPPNTTVTIHGVDHGAFIERYAIGTTHHLGRIILDSFYPNELESILKPIIIEEIQGTMEALYQHELKLQ